MPSRFAERMTSSTYAVLISSRRREVVPELEARKQEALCIAAAAEDRRRETLRTKASDK
jgi:hypothetical protein